MNAINKIKECGMDGILKKPLKLSEFKALLWEKCQNILSTNY